MFEPRHAFTAKEARRFGEQIGIDWASAPFDVEQFRIGMRDLLRDAGQGRLVAAMTT
jgi:hypothetical protein